MKRKRKTHHVNVHPINALLRVEEMFFFISAAKCVTYEWIIIICKAENGYFCMQKKVPRDGKKHGTDSKHRIA